MKLIIILNPFTIIGHKEAQNIRHNIYPNKYSKRAPQKCKQEILIEKRKFFIEKWLN